MRFVSIATLALSFISAAVALPASKEDLNVLTTALSAAAIRVTALDTAVNSVFVTSFSVQAAVTAFDFSVGAVTAVAAITSPLDDVDSEALVASLQQWNLTIAKTFSDLQAREGVLIGFSVVVLTKLQTDIEKLETALLAIVAETSSDAVASIFVQISISVQATISAVS